jgi:hypothetical protein
MALTLSFPAPEASKGSPFSAILKLSFSANAIQLLDAPVSMSNTAFTPLIRDWQTKCLVLVNFNLIFLGGVFLNKEHLFYKCKKTKP